MRRRAPQCPEGREDQPCDSHWLPPTGAARFGWIRLLRAHFGAAEKDRRWSNPCRKPCLRWPRQQGSAPYREKEEKDSSGVPIAAREFCSDSYTQPSDAEIPLTLNC